LVEVVRTVNNASPFPVHGRQRLGLLSDSLFEATMKPISQTYLWCGYRRHETAVGLSIHCHLHFQKQAYLPDGPLYGIAQIIL
jgi:hypothetical protein